MIHQLAHGELRKILEPLPFLASSKEKPLENFSGVPLCSVSLSWISLPFAVHYTLSKMAQRVRMKDGGSLVAIIADEVRSDSFSIFLFAIPVNPLLLT